MKHKIRKAARGQPCTIRAPGVCNHDPETTVLAHAPCIDKGMGIKGPDWWGAFACSSCHDFLDGRAISPIDDSTAKPTLWLQGIYETQRYLRGVGLL